MPINANSADSFTSAIAKAENGLNRRWQYREPGVDYEMRHDHHAKPQKRSHKGVDFASKRRYVVMTAEAANTKVRMTMKDKQTMTVSTTASETESMHMHDNTYDGIILQVDGGMSAD